MPEPTLAEVLKRKQTLGPAGFGAPPAAVPAEQPYQPPEYGYQVLANATPADASSAVDTGVGGLMQQAWGGLKGLGRVVAKGLRGEKYGSGDEMLADANTGLQEGSAQLPVPPPTEGGERLLKTAMNPLNQMQRGADALADKTSDAGFPNLAAGISIAPNLFTPEGTLGKAGAGLKALREGSGIGKALREGYVPGAGSSLAERERTLTAIQKTQSGQRALGAVNFDLLSPEEMKILAESEFHIIPKKGGGYEGAPNWVKTPEDLEKMRADIDQALADGAFGHKWYSEHGAPAIKKYTTDSRPGSEVVPALSLGAYSPQKSVDSSVDQTLSHFNKDKLGLPNRDYVTKPRKKGQEVGERVQLAAPLEHTPDNLYNQNESAKTGQVISAAEKGTEYPELGPKAGPFGWQLAGQFGNRTVNDTWMGNVFGHPKNMGFSEPQHNFMTAETHLAVERAKQKGLLPEDASGHHGQAAIWTGRRLQESLAAAEPQLAAFRKAGDKAGEQALINRLKSEAYEPFSNIFDRYQATNTHSLVPGFDDHMAGAKSLPYKDQREFHDAASWSRPAAHDEGATRGHDALTEAFFPMAAPSERTAGYWDGKFEPNESAGPLISWKKGKPGAVPEEASNESLQAMNAFRTLVDAQKAGAISYPRIPGSENAKKGANAARLVGRISEADALKMTKAAEQAGLSFTHGGNVSTLSNQFDANFPGTPEQFTAALKKPGLMPAGVEAHPSLYGSDYFEVPGAGKGVATAAALDRITPRAGAKLDASSRVRKVVGDRNDIERDFSNKKGLGPPRADYQKLRSLIQQHGIEGVRKMVAAAGGGAAGAAKLGLPAVLLSVALGERDKER